MLSVLQEPLSDHTQSLDYVLDYLKLHYSGTIKDEVAALGHRVVHGRHLSEPMLVDEKVMQVCSFLLMFLASTLVLVIHIRFMGAVPVAESLYALCKVHTVDLYPCTHAGHQGGC